MEEFTHSLKELVGIYEKDNLASKACFNRGYSADWIYSIDRNYINEYEVVDDKNHLKTVKLLVENEEVEWDNDIK